MFYCYVHIQLTKSSVESLTLSAAQVCDRLDFQRFSALSRKWHFELPAFSIILSCEASQYLNGQNVCTSLRPINLHVVLPQHANSFNLFHFLIFCFLQENLNCISPSSIFFSCFFFSKINVRQLAHSTVNSSGFSGIFAYFQKMVALFKFMVITYKFYSAFIRNTM